ncbi:MAG: class I SAM-dependent methyltransferase [Saprospiraceae bacterium]
MKLIYTLLLTTLFFGITSCVGEYNNGTDNSLSQSHKYGSTTSGNSELEQAIRDKENPDRNNWQKPRQVIERLGILTDKVVADIGAGSGYFSFQILPNAGKVIAIDIDPNALAQIDTLVKRRPDLEPKLETRLVGFNDPKLKDEEVDIVFISNTYSYIENKVDYLKTVFEGVKPKGRIYIVDFKMKILPQIFPKAEERVPLFEVEKHLQEAGFKHIFSDDKTLDYQYIVIAEKE